MSHFSSSLEVDQLIESVTYMYITRVHVVLQLIQIDSTGNRPNLEKT